MDFSKIVGNALPRWKKWETASPCRIPVTLHRSAECKVLYDYTPSAAAVPVLLVVISSKWLN